MIVGNANVGLLLRNQEFSSALMPRTSLWNANSFRGKSLSQASIFWHGNFSQFYWSGECAVDQNSAFAFSHSIRLHPDPNVGLIFNQEIESPSWFQSGKRHTVQALLSFKLRKGVQISAFHQMQKQLWLKYLETELGFSNKSWLRVTKKRKRDYELSFQALKVQMLDSQRFLMRFQYVKSFGPSTRWKSRAEWKGNQLTSPHSWGRGFLTELRFRHQPTKLTCYARLTLFGSNNYSNRFLAYENNVLYSYSVTSLQSHGTRQSLLLVYKPNRKIKLSLKLASTTYLNSLSVGAGLDKREGKRWHDINFQLQIKV